MNQDILHSAELVEIGEYVKSADVAINWFKGFCKEFDASSLSRIEKWEAEDNCHHFFDVILDIFILSDLNKDEKTKLLRKIMGIDGIYKVTQAGVIDDCYYHNILSRLCEDDPLTALKHIISNYPLLYNKRDLEIKTFNFLKLKAMEEQFAKAVADNAIFDGLAKEYLHQLISNGNSDKAYRILKNIIELKKGQDDMQNTNSGNLGGWYEIFLPLVEERKENVEIEEYLRQIFIEKHGDVEAYHQLKKLVEPDQWKQYFYDLLDCSGDMSNNSDVLAQIYAEEEEVELLLNCILSQGRNLTHLASYRFVKCIPSEYTKEIIDDIDPLLHFYTEKKNTKYYTVIVDTLKNLREMEGCQQYVKKVVQEFKEAYAKRKKFVKMLEEI